MPDTQLQQLFHKFLGEQMTGEEIKQLQLLIRDESNTAELDELLQAAYTNPSLAVSSDHDMNKVYEELNVKKSRPAPVRYLFWKRITVAASILLIVSLGSYFLFFNKTQKQIAKTEQHYKNYVIPGGNKAILTLANGQQIILDSAANGTITQQGNTKIIKLDSGQLAYNTLRSFDKLRAGSAQGDNEILYNTISTPRGGQYQIVLADGSKVWLNAASSLRFPTSFHKDRNVELTGEGYFEVAHDAAKPFNVSVNGMNVQVLGTHFNINAYDDENIIRATLLEGSVKVSKNSISKIIKPGEQAQLTNDQIKIINADVDEAVAWKNGFFSFQNADIQTVMRQLSRWYDVQVQYQGEVPHQQFTGKIGRGLTLSEVLKGLEQTRVHFKIEDGKRIVILP